MREQRAQGRRQGEKRAGGVLQPVVDVLFHQGADDAATVRTPAPWPSVSTLDEAPRPQ
jgi:hypothetical protein